MSYLYGQRQQVSGVADALEGERKLLDESEDDIPRTIQHRQDRVKEDTESGNFLKSLNDKDLP